MNRRIGCGLVGVTGLTGAGALAALVVAGLCMVVCAGGLGVLAVPEVLRADALARETRKPKHAAPRPPEAPGRFVAGPEGPIYVQVHGRSGPTVLLVHGSAAWSGTWRDTQRALASAGYRVVAVDLPPFGYSARPVDGPYDREAQAARLLAVLDELRIRRAAVVGHSFGGGPVLELALRHPDRLWGLALLDVALALEEPDSVDRIDQLLEVKRVREWMVAATFTNPRATQTVLEQFIADPADATPDRVELYQRPLDIDGTTEAIADWLPELWSPDRDVWSFDEGRFDRIDVPVAVLWGTADTVTPLEQGEHLVKAMPRARLHRLEGLGHIPHIEDPEAVHAVLVPYLQHAHAIWQRKAGPIR